jgi:hypothetical protein
MRIGTVIDILRLVKNIVTHVKGSLTSSDKGHRADDGGAEVNYGC